MNPAVARFQTLFASARAGRDILDLIGVSTLCHVFISTPSVENWELELIAAVPDHCSPNYRKPEAVLLPSGEGGQKGRMRAGMPKRFRILKPSPGVFLEASPCRARAARRHP